MLSLFQIAILFAQVSDQSNRPGDEAAIRRTWDSFVAAFNEGDAKACAALYTEDGDRVDSVSGKSSRGRADIERSYVNLFGGRYNGGVLVGNITSIRFLTPEVAIVDLVSEVKELQGGSAKTQLRATTIYLKRGGTWAIAAHRPSLRP